MTFEKNFFLRVCKKSALEYCGCPHCFGATFLNEGLSAQCRKLGIDVTFGEYEIISEEKKRSILTQIDNEDVKKVPSGCE